MSWLKRTELLVGSQKLEALKRANVLIVGLGGVGAYVCEQLCRAGIGKLTIADGDVVEESNRNRQLPALVSTNGQPKAEIVAQRLRDINPEIELTVVNEFISDEKTVELLESQPFDYVVDAIDTLSPKVFLISHSIQRGMKVVSSLGAGGKFDPTKVQIADISKSYNCNLGRALRKRLSKLGIKNGFMVVFSPENIPEYAVRTEEGRNKRSTVGTISYMPPVFGCFVASVVINYLLKKQLETSQSE